MAAPPRSPAPGGAASPAGRPVLVTGGAGFLGSHLVRRLVELGHRVIALDARHDQGRLPDDLPGVQRVTGDLRDEGLLRELVAASSRVFHHAAIAGVHEYVRRPLEVLEVNLEGTRRLLFAARDASVPVLLASTSEAYGKNPARLGEDADTWLGPTTSARWCYATSKVAGEHYAWALAREGLPVAAVRYFNVYGPMLDAPGTGRVLAQFLGALQRNEPLRLVDGGQAVRCFCWIDDAIEATVTLGLALGPGSPLVGRPYNVGNPEPVSMRDLADAVLRLSGHAAGTVDVPGSQFFGAGFEDIPSRIPDVDALERAIGWRATTTLEEGLRRTLAHWDLLREGAAPPPPRPIPVLRPCYDADAALLGRYRRALDAGRTSNGGPEVVALEAEAAAWLGVDAVLATGSGADALNVAVRALGVRGRAILPSFTYVSTLNAVELAGLEPVFCDVDPETWTLSVDHLAELLATVPDVAVVLPVAVFGVPPDLDAVTRLAAVRGLPVVYDAAHAVGTEVDGYRHDPRPTATIYSLHATKVLPATEGGLLVVGDPALRARMAQVRTHGLAPDPLDSVPGYNAKMDELAAATARHGLTRLDATLRRRREYGERLVAVLREAGFGVQRVPPGVRTNFQNLGARVPGDLATAVAVLAEHGVESRRYFHPPLHTLRRFDGRFHLPHTEALHAQLLHLPLHSRMDEATLRRVEAAIRAVGRA